jgi:hypothetical protein
MSKNIVDAIIDYDTNVKNCVGIIASRRQIDYCRGYVNNWTTQEFAKYVKDKNPNIIICRDHGGINQGNFDDDGEDSFLVDAQYMDIIHIDPFKKFILDNSIEYTVDIIKKCSEINNDCLFEVGTEEAIFHMTSASLDYFLHSIRSKIPKLFSKIVYAVIQSGTSLKSGVNTGEYNRAKLLTMVDICKAYKVLSKEHNGDYLLSKDIKLKFKTGLSAINIAPEIAHIETEYILNNISENGFNKWFDLCLNDGRWSKWFPKDFDPHSDVDKVLLLCGHYVLTNPNFIHIFDLSTGSKYIKEKVFKFINERI